MYQTTSNVSPCVVTMSTYVVFIFLTCQIFVCPVDSAAATFFRKDYNFFPDQRAFYKVHSMPKCWNQARLQCSLESSALAVPNSAAEAAIFKDLIQKNIGDNSKAYVGIQALYKGIFTTLNGIPLDALYHAWAPGEPNDPFNEYCVVMRSDGKLEDTNCLIQTPFICEKSQDDVTWNYNCETSDLAYVRMMGTDHCYKLHLEPKSWLDAYATCMAEQSYLAILNSRSESSGLSYWFNTKPHQSVTGDFLAGVIHLGFYERLPEGIFMTIQGQTLTEAGFDQWAYKQPDNPRFETCGSMFYNGQLNDIGCDRRCFFICERVAGDGSSALSVRSGR